MLNEPDNEINVDELLSEIEAPSPERGMTSDETPEAAAPEPEAATWNGQEWEFEWNGKKIAPDSRDKAKIWMSQGYNYSQRMGELNKTHAQKVADAEQRARAASELEQRFSPYAKVDEYAKQNKEWWDFVQQQYDQRQSQQPQMDPNLQNLIKPLEEKLGKFEQYFGQIEQQNAQKVEQEQDQALDTEIGSIRKEHPNIDLGAVDPESGETLELRILKHSQSIGTSSFKAAFWDYLGPKLIQEAKASGREAIAKDAQQQAKKGILGKTPAPVKQGLKPVNTKAPWNDPQFSAENILKEMGIS